MGTQINRVEWWLPGAGRRHEKILVKEYKLSVKKSKSSENLMYSMLTIVSNTVSYT